MQLSPHFIELLKEAELNSEKIAEGLQLEPSVFVRPNPSKFPSSIVPAHADKGIIQGTIKLPYRPVFSLDPLFHAGAYYVQDGSSAFLGTVIRAIAKLKKIELAVDVCAAPGGKSTLLLDNLPPNTLLLANEVNYSRYEILHENITKWGNPNVMLSKRDPRELGEAGIQADLLLTDVPCSGEGMFRKDEKALEMWSPDLVLHCAMRQKRIIAEVLPALKDGGILIYSTCTFNRRENEEIIMHFQEFLEPIPLLLEHQPGLMKRTENGFDFYRFLPDKDSGEGLTFCVVRKTGEKTRKVTFGKKRLRNVLQTVNPPVDLHPSYRLFMTPDKRIRLFSNPETDVLVSLLQSGFIADFGLIWGQKIAQGYQREHGAAMAGLNGPDLDAIDLNLHQALRYQRRETFDLINIKKGENIVAYKGVRLGFIKNIGTRWNNLLPKNYRLRMELPKPLPPHWWIEPAKAQ